MRRDDVETIGVRKLQWCEQHTVEDAEHRGVEPDSEAQREHGDRGEAR